MPAVHAAEAPTAQTHEVTLILSDLRAVVCAAAARFDAQLLDRDNAAFAMVEWSAIAHAAETAVALAAARVDECGAPPSAGAASPADFVAKTTGTTTAKATEKIKSGRGLRTSTRVRERAAAGALSPDQTAAITDALTVNPAAEDRLLGAADTNSLGGLRDACAQAKTEGQDVAAIEKRIHRNRHVRRYRDKEGAEHLHAVGTKATMAKVDAALKPLIDAQFKKAHAEGLREPLEAYAYDALIDLAAGSTSSDAKVKPTIRNLTVVRVDLEALTRGATETDETCEIVGLGPISVETARAMLGESIIKLVITKGVDVRNVTHLGRGPNTAQKIALLWEHSMCMRERCGHTARLQYNHAYDFEYCKTKHTRVDETEPLCDPDHELQTRHGWSLVVGTGRRPMVPPDDPRHPKNRPKP